MGFVDIYDGCDGSEVIRYFFTWYSCTSRCCKPITNVVVADHCTKADLFRD